MVEKREDIRWRLKKGDCIYFLHIPKTAGTTVYQYVMNRFNPGEILIYPDEDVNKNFIFTYPDDFINFRFYRQHFPYSFYTYLPRKPVYLTFLRNPITRVLSLYNHIRRTTFHRWYEFVVKSDIGIVNFVNNTPIQAVSNFQVNYLSSYFYGKLALGDRDKLEIAKMRLHEFAYFGIQEQFSDSMELLHYTFGWDQVDYNSYNIAPSRTNEQELNLEELKAIRERNELDLRLYEYALQLFANRLDIMRRDIKGCLLDGV